MRERSEGESGMGSFERVSVRRLGGCNSVSEPSTLNATQRSSTSQHMCHLERFGETIGTMIEGESNLKNKRGLHATLRFQDE